MTCSTTGSWSYSAGHTVDELLAELEGDAGAVAPGGRLQGTQISRLVQDLGGLLVPLNQIARVFGEEARDTCASALESSAAGDSSAADE